jgi:4-amino-4-deoxy-L-arabinose transferase-like glycosyltransferase
LTPILTWRIIGKSQIHFSEWIVFILPLFCFLFVFLLLRKFRVLDWRGSFLLASLIWGVLIAAITEFLSLFEKLNFWSLLGVWGIIVLLLLLFLMIKNWKPGNLHLDPPLVRLSRFEFGLLVYILFIIGVIGVMAWVAPPNTWDSMTYHLSRVMHWIQNKSVAFYPTHVQRQLYQNPWSEFAILHFQLLSGSDRFANLIQWFSMVGSIVGVSLLAKVFKATIRGQIFAALVCATIPMGILQGSSTQTDYVVSFWLVCLVYFTLLLGKKADLLSMVGAGLALGLAILTKATAYIFALPFLIWMGLASLKSRRVKNMLYTALVGVIALTINLGQYVRNYDLYGNPLGPGQESENIIFANELFSPAAVASNLIRNVSLHLGTPFSQLNAVLDSSISRLHHWMGISPNDVRTTWSGIEFHTQSLSFHEDYTGNPIHLLLIIVAILLYIFQREKERWISFYILSLLAGFLLFCAYLKWQPWHSRLHLPLFVLFAPFVGFMLSRISASKIANASMLLLSVLALPWMLFNSSKPVYGANSIFTVGRIEQYFKNRPALTSPYVESVNILSDRHCSAVGLMMGIDDWEYPFWVLLGEKMGGMVHLEHVNVANLSQEKYSEDRAGTLSLCALIVIGPDPPAEISVGKNIYSREWTSIPVSVYGKVASP